MEGGEKK